MTIRQAPAGLAGIEDGEARRTSGGFLHSCVNHVEGDNTAAWEGYAVDGVTMRAAVASWHGVVATTGGAPPGWSAPLHVGCRRQGGAAPPLCNPTCSVQ